MTTLVYGRSLLTGQLHRPEITGGGLIIDGSRIVDVGQAVELRKLHSPDVEIGGQDRVLLPGLVSAHQHGAGVGSVQLGCPDDQFERWIVKMFFVPPLDPYLDTLSLAIKFIERGITTTLHSHYTRDPARYEAELELHLHAWEESGMRVAFAPCFLDRNNFLYGANETFMASLPQSLASEAMRMINISPSIADYLDVVAALRDRFRTSDRMRVLLGPLAPQWCSREALERMASDGRPAEGVHTHLLETPAQRRHLDRWLGRSIVGWLDELGFVTPAASFAHGVWLNPEEIECLGDRGARIVHNPGSNLRLGNGIARIPELVAAGVPIALGTDEMSIGDDNDLLGEARLAGVLHRSRGLWLKPAELLNMATEQGAAAARLDDLTGTLAKGKLADVVLVDATQLEDLAVVDGISMLDLIISRGRGVDARTVLIGGRVVYDEGRHTWIDRNELVSEMRALAHSQSAGARGRRLALVGDEMTRALDDYASALGEGGQS